MNEGEPMTREHFEEIPSRSTLERVRMPVAANLATASLSVRSSRVGPVADTRKAQRKT